MSISPCLFQPTLMTKWSPFLSNALKERVTCIKYFSYFNNYFTLIINPSCVCVRKDILSSINKNLID